MLLGTILLYQCVGTVLDGRKKRGEKGLGNAAGKRSSVRACVRAIGQEANAMDLCPFLKVQYMGK